MLIYIPLILSIAVIGILLLPQINSRADVALNGIGLRLFGDAFSTDARQRTQRPQMEAAHIPQSHRSFVSQTVLYSVLIGIAAGLASLTIFSLLFSFVEGLSGTVGFVSSLAKANFFDFWSRLISTLLLSGVTAIIVGAVAYWLRWVVVGQLAYARGSRIDATLPRTVALMYALSRSGMAYTEVLRTLGNNREVYGEAAVEVNATVRQMDLFGVDLQTGLKDLSNRTPSEDLSELIENLGSVLGSGRSLSSYLQTQYVQYKEQAEDQQQQYLEMLATFAEAYVTVLVAGPLFLITTLAVIGLTLQDTLPIMRIIIYVGIPLGTIAFIIYVDSVTNSTRSIKQNRTTKEVNHNAPVQQVTTSAGGSTVQSQWSTQRETLDMYDTLNRVLNWLKQPTEIILRNPHVTLLATGPISLLWVAFRIGSFELSILSILEALAWPLAEVGIFIFSTYAVVYEIRKRQARQIEVAIPDFLDRYASVNDAGMTIIDGFQRVKNSDLGALSPELERTWQDIQWGSDVGTALKRMDQRIGSAVVTRAVTLTTNAMETSGDIAPVLEIAADEARSSQALSRQRKQIMSTYLIVIYIAFFVFMGIIAALMLSFIPAIEDVAVQTASGPSDGVTGGTGMGLTGGMEDIDITEYEALFFHVTLVQAVCSGLIAGQLGNGSVKSGTKHVAILLLATYLLFNFI